MILERGSRLVNRYRIVEILGQGGMGSVYRSVDENLNMEVAVKDNLFTTEEYARQFRREAEILAGLRHANLPRVTDHFVIDGQGQYLVMDYIEGEDLRQRMDRQGTLTDQEVSYIGAAVCDALAYLHSRRPPIVHRDIKPGNIKITPHGGIFLVDFGLAKTIDGSQATTTGARAMTPGYSPPEQYGTARTDHRSDVFSLGATLYAALTGAIPEDALSRAMDQCDLTPIRSHNPKVSKRLASVIEKSLEVRPDERYQGAEDFKQALLSALTPSQRRQDNYVVAPPPEGVEVGIETSGVGVFVSPLSHGARSRNGGSAPLPVSMSINEPLRPGRLGPRRRRPTWLFGLVGVVTVIFLTLYALELFRPGMLAPLWAAFVPPPTATPTAPATIPPAGGVTTPGSGAVLPPVAGATATLPVVAPTVTATSAPTATPTATFTPSPTPTPVPTPLGGGGQIAFASDPVTDPTGDFQIYMVDLDGQNEVKITAINGGACQPDWSPDGMRLVFISPCERNQPIYPNSGLFVINADGSDLKPLTIGGVGGYDPDWSPDGNKIAFTSVSRTGRPEIGVLNLEDGSVQFLSEFYSRDMEPSWSPDGKQIVFITERFGGRQLWRMNADGSDPQQISENNGHLNYRPSWSPDMSAILFTQLVAEKGIPRLMMIFPNQEEYVEFPFSPEKIPMRESSWSPDGYWVAFEAWDAGANHNIYIAAANGAGRTQVSQGNRSEFDAAWRPTP